MEATTIPCLNLRVPASAILLIGSCLGIFSISAGRYIIYGGYIGIIEKVYWCYILRAGYRILKPSQAESILAAAPMNTCKIHTAKTFAVRLLCEPTSTYALA